jgi:hypothetical protein
MLPACDLQADLSQDLQLSTFVRETPGLLQFSSLRRLRSEVRCTGSGQLRCSLCSGLCPEVRCSGSGQLRCSLCPGLCPEVRCSGSGHVRCSLCSGLCPEVRCSGSGHVRCSVCSGLCCTGSGDLRRSLCSRTGSGQVLRLALPVEVLRQRQERLRYQVLQCRSLRSCSLDL